MHKKTGEFRFALNLTLLIILIALLSSCSRRLGYGILLWAAEEPPIPSGTVLPVYIRSNIDQVWVAGIPSEYRVKGDRIDKFEIPLAKLELAGSKKKALQRAEAFAPYALTYAETIQDGLPIRESPDNGARRVYRLKHREIIKILSPAKGNAAVGTTGIPLPGEWFRVLTEDGTTGYCFSYRLKLFEHSGGALAALPQDTQIADDPDLEELLARRWSAEAYGSMVNSRRIVLEDLSQHWGFDPGQDTGMAHIKIKDLDRSFSYTGIKSTGTRSWRFEESTLQMELRSDTTLAVQFIEEGGALRTILFVALSTEVDDLIEQETSRREGLFNTIYTQGPGYTSHNYGTITFSEDGRFTWTGYDLLTPQVIPASALGNGSVSMRLFLAAALADRYAGAFTLYFGGVSGASSGVNFMYSLDSQGFRLEYVPDTSLDIVTVSRRASSPLVLYFFRVDPPPELSEFGTDMNQPSYSDAISGLRQDGAFMEDDDYYSYDENQGSPEDDDSGYLDDDSPTDF
nr:SH3 domain-containing protein [Leadbettera azotonutricia]